MPGTLRVGPLLTRPRLSIVNIGVDGNVFNETEDPKSDFTFSVLPAVDVQFRVRRLVLQATSGLAYQYFHEYAGERSTNGTQSLQLEWPLTRLTLRSSASFASVRERPGLEIDLRARRQVGTYAAGADLRMLSKTSLRFGASRSTTVFKSGVVDDVSLPAALNRSTETAQMSLRHSLTSLTTIVLTAEALRDEFDSVPERNATGYRVLPGVEFSRFALISGGASVGFRRFEPESPLVPGYSGLAARVSLATVLRGNSRISAQVDRDVEYSYSVDRPYFLQTNVGVAVTHRLTPRWDVVASGFVQNLKYHGEIGTPVVPTTPDDAAEQPSGSLRGAGYSFGIGYHVGRGIRVALDGRRTERDSDSAARRYTGWQIGSSVTYGF